jgi:hypothetical protein
LDELDVIAARSSSSLSHSSKQTTEKAPDPGKQAYEQANHASEQATEESNHTGEESADRAPESPHYTHGRR